MTDTRTPEPWPARTARLQVRPCTPADVDAMWEWRRLPEVNRWLGAAPDTRDAFRERYLDPERLASLYIVELLPDAEGTAPTPIGDIMVRRGDGWAQLEVDARAKGVEAELGWVLDPAHTGHGYATEAIRAVTTCASAHWACAGCMRGASPTTSRPGASWSGSGCAERSSAGRRHCIARANGSTA